MVALSLREPLISERALTGDGAAFKGEVARSLPFEKRCRPFGSELLARAIRFAPPSDATESKVVGLVLACEAA